MNRTSLSHRRRSCARVVSRRASPVERLEGRVLLAANAWKSAVSGNWTDATRWSLGHVPTVTEDVSITIAGSYTVTAPGPAGTQLVANSLKVGGTSGTQVLNVGATIHVTGAFSVGAGDSINLNGGRIISFAT